MKAKETLLAIGVGCLGAAAFGQSYTMEWHTIAGGGVTSTNGGRVIAMSAPFKHKRLNARAE